MLVAAVAASGRLGDCSGDRVLAQPVASTRARDEVSGRTPAASAMVAPPGSWPPAPTTRQGSAGGPRAP